MSENKFTPGPWLMDMECNVPTGRIAVGREKYSGFEVRTNDNWPVAFIPVYFDEQPSPSMCPNKIELDWDEAQANLLLIAAAPELLEALVNLLDAHAVPSSGCKERPAYDAAIAAVAKARGES